MHGGPGRIGPGRAGPDRAVLQIILSADRLILGEQVVQHTERGLQIQVDNICNHRIRTILCLRVNKMKLKRRTRRVTLLSAWRTHRITLLSAWGLKDT